MLLRESNAVGVLFYTQCTNLPSVCNLTHSICDFILVIVLSRSNFVVNFVECKIFRPKKYEGMQRLVCLTGAISWSQMCAEKGDSMKHSMAVGLSKT